MLCNYGFSRATLWRLLVETAIAEPCTALGTALINTEVPIGPEVTLALAAVSVTSAELREAQKHLVYKSLNSVNTLPERVFTVLYLLYVCLSGRQDILKGDNHLDRVWTSLRDVEDDVTIEEEEKNNQDKSVCAIFLLNKFRQLAGDLSLSTWMEWVEVAPPKSAYLKEWLFDKDYQAGWMVPSNMQLFLAHYAFTIKQMVRHITILNRLFV